MANNKINLSIPEKNFLRNSSPDVQSNSTKPSTTNERPIAVSQNTPNIKIIEMFSDASNMKTIKRETKKGTTYVVGPFQLGEMIGKGAFGCVYKGLNSINGEVVAVKRIPIHSSSAAESLVIEIQILKNFNHLNIIKYKDFVISENNLNFVIEFAEGGSLAYLVDRYGPLIESLTCLYTYQVLKGLEYLHSNKIIHHDIKAANILSAKSGIVKLADFGIAKFLVDEKNAELNFDLKGSPYWIAPELLAGKAATESCDIWAVACTIHELLTGIPPYGNFMPLSALFKIMNEGHAPLPENMSPELIKFMESCYAFESNLRPSATELCTSPWFKDSNIYDLQLEIATKEMNSIQASAQQIISETAINSNNNLRTSQQNEEGLKISTTKVSAPTKSPKFNTFSSTSSKINSRTSGINSKTGGSSRLLLGILDSSFDLINNGNQSMKVCSVIAFGKYIWLGTNDGSIVVYSSKSKELVSVNANSHNGVVNGLLITPTIQSNQNINAETRIWSCSSDSTIKIWNSDIGTFSQSHKGWLVSRAVVCQTLPTTKSGPIITKSNGRKKRYYFFLEQDHLKFYNNENDKEPKGLMILGEQSMLTSDKSKNRRYCLIISCINTGKMRRLYAQNVEEHTEWMKALFSATLGKCIKNFKTIPMENDCEVTSIVALEKEVFTGSNDMTIRIWDMKDYTCLQKIKIAIHPLQSHIDNTICRMILFPVQNDHHLWLAVGNIIYRYSVNTMQLIDFLEGHSKLINAITIVDQSTIWSCGNDKKIYVWNSLSGKCIHNWEAHNEEITSLLWIGETVWSAGRANAGRAPLIKMWDINNYKLVKELVSNKKEISEMIFVEMTRAVWTTGNTNDICIWK
eukprot:TRINITY_DN438_c0_g1_i5.p1 TRINITY_DN438_c0_g1~~TRINITY_DN438_c0_g1_i5.p1  ORF type:complete len:872 (+),score=342.39 TRINITY_DN438_c0_g1_i5:45-2618(+)